MKQNKNSDSDFNQSTTNVKKEKKTHVRKTVKPIECTWYDSPSLLGPPLILKKMVKIALAITNVFVTGALPIYHQTHKK